MVKNHLSAFSALAILLITISPAFAAPQSAPTPYEVIAAVNALRASHGLPPYLVDPILMMAAQGQADYLASTPGFGSGHVGPGSTDPDARAHNLGYPEVPGLDINENWGTLREGDPIETLIFGGWNDTEHMHTMLHDRGQHVGAGVAVSGDRAYIILDVAAFWGDAGLTAQPTTSAFGENAATQYAVSQYIAPVIKATSAPDGLITHTVMSGQSLWILSSHYEVAIERLRQLNNMGSFDTIYIGQKILIQLPMPATATSVFTATSQPSASPQPSLVTTDKSAERPPVRVSPTQLVIQTPKSDESGWYLLFFGLFGVGVILVVISFSGKK